MLWGSNEEIGRDMNIAGLTLLVGERRRLEKVCLGVGLWDPTRTQGQSDPSDSKQSK